MPVNAFEEVVGDLVVVGYGPCVMRNDVERVLEASDTANDSDICALSVQRHED